jgi:hypothetical protein
MLRALLFLRIGRTPWAPTSTNRGCPGSPAPCRRRQDGRSSCSWTVKPAAGGPGKDANHRRHAVPGRLQPLPLRVEAGLSALCDGTTTWQHASRHGAGARAVREARLDPALLPGTLLAQALTRLRDLVPFASPSTGKDAVRLELAVGKGALARYVRATSVGDPPTCDPLRLIPLGRRPGQRDRLGADAPGPGGSPRPTPSRGPHRSGCRGRGPARLDSPHHGQGLLVRHRLQDGRPGSAQRRRPGQARSRQHASTSRAPSARSTSTGTKLKLVADDEPKMEQLKDVLDSKLIKRGVSTKGIEWGKLEAAGHMTVRQEASLKAGIPSPTPRRSPPPSRKPSRSRCRPPSWATTCASRANPRTTCRTRSRICAAGTGRSTSNSRTSRDEPFLGSADPNGPVPFRDPLRRWPRAVVRTRGVLGLQAPQAGHLASRRGPLGSRNRPSPARARDLPRHRSPRERSTLRRVDLRLRAPGRRDRTRLLDRARGGRGRLRTLALPRLPGHRRLRRGRAPHGHLHGLHLGRGRGLRPGSRTLRPGTRDRSGPPRRHEPRGRLHLLRGLGRPRGAMDQRRLRPRGGRAKLGAGLEVRPGSRDPSPPGPGRWRLPPRTSRRLDPRRAGRRPLDRDEAWTLPLAVESRWGVLALRTGYAIGLDESRPSFGVGVQGATWGLDASLAWHGALGLSPGMSVTAGL